MTVSDKSLAEAFAGGDEEAFTELVRRHAGAVRSLAIHMVGDPHLADDILQQVFLRTYKQGPALAEIDNLRAWLIRVAANRCLTLLRQRSRRPTSRSLDATVEQLLAGPDNTVEAAERHERAERLHEALDAIPAAQRMTLALHYQEGLSYAEIAERLDTTVNTIKSRFRRAKERLRGKLKDLYPEPIR